LSDPVVRTSTRLWSQIVAEARAGNEADFIGPGEQGIDRLLETQIPAYEFSTGRKFGRKASDPYA